MKATGIVRRIDDLGRIVIPKEIRRTMRIREADPLEIFTNHEGEIILKKYSPIGELGEFAKEYADSLAQVTGHTVCITDRDQVIAVAGAPKKEYLGKSISSQLDKVINSRSFILADKTDKKFVKITDEDEDITSETISPIICEGDAIGSVAIFGKESSRKMGEVEQKLATSAAGFLGKQMES